jgi:hypothetical protein
MPGGRIDKTLAKLRVGALPSWSEAERAFRAGGNGMECSGCGERIGPLESAYYVRLTGATSLRLHAVCHETWLRFKQPA